MQVSSAVSSLASGPAQSYQAISGSERTESQANESKEVRPDGDESSKRASLPAGVGKAVDISA